MRLPLAWAVGPFAVLPRLLILQLVLWAAFSSAYMDFTNKTIADIFWQLRTISTRHTRNVYFGGQNSTACCLLAVNESLTVTDGHLAFTAGHENWITIQYGPDINTAEALYNYSQRGQFPCTAVYDGHKDGAPLVKVPYKWLSDHCPGWSVNDHSNINAWLQPLSSFLIPAVIFCLSVPRRRKLEFSFVLRNKRHGFVLQSIFATLDLLLALSIKTVDTIVWLCVCFAFAGPMILSGLYESMLDNILLNYLRRKIDHNCLTLDMRCRCLMIILIGNLDLIPDEDDSHGPNPYENPFDQSQFDGPGSRQRLGSAVASENSGTEYLLIDRNDHSSYLSHEQNANMSPNSALYNHGSSMAGARFEASNTSIYLQVPSQAQTHEEGPAAAAGVTANLLSEPSPSEHTLEATVSAASASQHGPEAVPQIGSQDSNNRNGNPFASPWKYMEQLLYELRLYGSNISNGSYSPRQYPICYHCVRPGICTHGDRAEQPRVRTPQVKSAIESATIRIKNRLHSMLNCQSSFGSMVGAPVIFYLGGFIFALLQSLDMLGDTNISEGLAFGQWYMIIPHIAIVSGVLLAGNNPNIYGVLAAEKEYRIHELKFLCFSSVLAYPSYFKVAWLWDRGHNKKQWVDKLVATYKTQVYQDFRINEEGDPDVVDLEAATTLSFLEWLVLLALTFLLIGLPFVLAFLTAYNTPEVGLSCRSMTFTIYISVQTCQILLWLWAYSGPPIVHGSTRLDFLRSGGWLDRHAFYKPASLRWKRSFEIPHNSPTLTALVRQDPNLLLSRGYWRTVCYYLWTVCYRCGRYVCWDFWRNDVCWNFVWNVLYYFGLTSMGSIGIMAVIGGTLMQLVGVYSANVCAVTTKSWHFILHDRKDEMEEMAQVSLNSPQMIYKANHIWGPCAITAILFMTIVAIVGWWYQRSRRELFFELVDDINEHERSDSLQSAGSENSSGHNRQTGSISPIGASNLSAPPSVRGSGATTPQDQQTMVNVPL